MSLKGKLKEIADAIRYIEDSVDPISATDFANRIKAYKNIIEERDPVSIYDAKFAYYISGSVSLASLPNELTCIGNCAFRDYSNLALTSLPSNVSNIGEYAFSGCTNLTVMTIGGQGKPMLEGSIASTSFYSCNNLTSMTIYTDGGQSLSTAPFGATNATITYIDSNI